MTESEPRPSINAALVSVGGSPAPVLYVLRQHQPRHVWYFCSSDSRTVAEEIQAQLDWHPAPRFIEVDRFEELGPCYRGLRRKLPEILAEARVKPEEVLVDYTGGTKTMSAALVLAASEVFQRFSYVGGKQREKGGLGVTLNGQEKVHYQGNPWKDFAIREIERARDLWAGCQFESAETVLREVAPRVPQQMRFEAVADLAEAMAARHRLDFKTAGGLLKRLGRNLPKLLDGRPDHGLFAFVDSAQRICEDCSRTTGDDPLLMELLDNALRTETQGRFEDAAARLYRVLELRGQLWLKEMTEGLFRDGRCQATAEDHLPAALRSLPFCQPDESGEIKLSLEQLYLALAALGHDRAKEVAADIAAAGGGRWRKATSQRNASILAHGVRPIGAPGLAQMKTLCEEFLGYDLSREAHPIPPLDARWLE